MTWASVLLALAGVCWGLRRLVRTYRRLSGPDPAWAPTGLRFTSGRDYLEDQAVAGAKRARLRTPSGRLYRSRKSAGLIARRAEVVPFRKKEAK